MSSFLGTFGTSGTTEIVLRPKSPPRERERERKRKKERHTNIAGGFPKYS
jgi:hypothetical protein